MTASACPDILGRGRTDTSAIHLTKSRIPAGVLTAPNRYAQTDTNTPIHHAATG
jgi:putative aminopeptidase FrvX